jgi:hypothetical protein
MAKARAGESCSTHGSQQTERGRAQGQEVPIKDKLQGPTTFNQVSPLNNPFGYELMIQSPFNSTTSWGPSLQNMNL